MSLDLRAAYKAWSTRANINGSSVRLASIPSRRIGFDQARSSANLTIMDTPSVTNGQAAWADVGWGGQLVRFYTGQVDSSAANEPQLQRAVTLVDVLGALRKRFPAVITWNNQSFQDAVFDILLAVGIPQVSHLYDPGFFLGAVQPITIGVDESPAQVFQQLMDYAGTIAWVAPDGGIRIDSLLDIPSTSYVGQPDGSSTVYAYGATGTELGIIGSSWQLGAPDRLVASVTIPGPKLPSGITPTGQAQLASTAAGEPYSQQMRFVQDATTAQTIAERELGRRAVQRTVLQFNAPLNPYLLPGQSIGFRDSMVGYSVTTPAFVWAVTTNGVTMQVTLHLGAHAENGYSVLQDPVAVFTVTVEYEPIRVAGVDTPKYFVQCDGSGSYDPDGTIVTYSWSAPGASPDTTSTLVNPLFVYSSITGQSITLTVTDNTGQTGTLTIALDDLAPTVVTRVLSVAEGTNGWAVLRDPAAWESYTRASRSCTAVPPFNESGPLLSGWDDGKLYSLAEGDTAITLVATMTGGSVGCIFVNESDEDNILVGVGAKLYRSTDGATFTLVKTFSSTVNAVQSSPDNDGELRAAVGKDVQISYDAGVTWTTINTGATGTIAQHIASAPWGHAATFTGGASATDALKFEEGYTVNWSAVVSPPTALYGITPMLTTPGYIVGDGNAQWYKLTQSGSNFVAVKIASGTGTTQNINDLLRDGQLGSMVYGATENGTYKMVNFATFFVIRDNPSLQIGYGQIGTPVVPVNVELVVPATTGRVWYLSALNGTWANRSTGLPTDVTWVDVKVSPFEPDTWVVTSLAPAIRGKPSSGKLVHNGTTHSPFYYTTNAGTSWTELVMAPPARSNGSAVPPGDGAAIDFIYDSMAWSRSKRWLSIVGQSDDSASWADAYIYAGNLASMTGGSVLDHTTGNGAGAFQAIGGTSEECFFVAHAEGNLSGNDIDKAFYTTTGATLVALSPLDVDNGPSDTPANNKTLYNNFTFNRAQCDVILSGGGRGVLGQYSADDGSGFYLFLYRDYRNKGVNSVHITTGSAVKFAWTDGDEIWIIDGANHLTRMGPILGSPIQTTDADPGWPAGYSSATTIRSDMKYKRAVLLRATVSGAGTCLVWKDDQWTAVADPSGAQLSGGDVIVRAI